MSYLFISGKLQMNRFDAYLMILYGILFSIETCCKVFIRNATCDFNVHQQNVLHVEMTEKSINYHHALYLFFWFV